MTIGRAKTQAFKANSTDWELGISIPKDVDNYVMNFWGFKINSYTE